MNIEQMKRNNLEIQDDIAYFVGELVANTIKFNPLTLSEFLTDAFLDGDDSFSIQVWFSTLNFLSSITLKKGSAIFSEDQRVKSYLRLIENIFLKMKDADIVFPYFINNRKWVKKIMQELDARTKAGIYAIDRYISNELTGINYIDMNSIFEEEHIKTKIMTEAYYSFINNK